MDVCATYPLVSSLSLSCFDLGMWGEKEKNLFKANNMVILRFFNSQHFFHNFARTRFVRTKVVVTPNLSYLWQHLMAYSESWVKAISKNGMSFSSTFWNHPKIQNRKTLSKFSGQLFQPFLDQILCFLLFLASTFTTFNHVKWNYILGGPFYAIH